MNIGFIGAGKAGTALGRYLVDQGNEVLGYASRTESSARSAARFTHTQAFSSMADLARACDLIFITTSDSALFSVWDSLRCAHRSGALNLTSKLIVHISGCCTSAVFEGAHELSAYVASAHPLLAFGNLDAAAQQLQTAHFSLEGDAQAVSVLSNLLTRAGNPVHVLEPEDKALYHAAAVFASNLVLAPLAQAEALLCSCGFTPADSREALLPLIRGNIENFCSLGAACALTGPVERADVQTVERHVQAFDAKALATTKALYLSLSQALVDLAREKHPDRDYGNLESALAANQ